MRNFIDKTSEQSGTPLNRDYLMAIQGFDAITITFNTDGSITEVNALGEIKTTIFNADGSITETFVSDNYRIIKKISFTETGIVTEVVS